MNKHIQKFFYAVALFGALAGMAVSCKDYDEDINNLDSKISTLESTVSSLKSTVDGGVVITSVTPTSDGITISTSDGKTYTITNGKNGTNGTNGKDGTNGTNGKDGKNGTVWTIGEDGYWYYQNDGDAAPIKTDYLAVGQNGKDGVDGKDGEDGKDGVYYYPGTDGYWYLVTDAESDPVGTKTDIMWTTSTGTDPSTTATVIWDDERDTITIIQDGKVYEIELVATAVSLVFVPQVYVDGVEGMLSSTVTYNALTLKNKDSEKETTSEASKASSVATPVIAEYHVNPTTAVLTDKEKYEFVVKENTPFKVTRSEAVDFAATPTFVSCEDGILKVKVDLEGIPASEELISVLALKVTYEEDTVSVVSDYATVFSDDLGELRIVEPNAYAKFHYGANVDVHYRRFIAETDSEAYNQEIVWSTNSDLEATKATCDTTVLYNGTLDLNQIVAAHTVSEEGCVERSKEELEALGLTFEFQVVKNYKVGSPETDQADFVTLEDGIFTPKVYSTEGKAAIGRTPIIRVLLKKGNDIVQVAYIKVFIGDEVTAPVDNSFHLNVYDEDGNLGAFSFDCDGDTLYTTVEEMNTKIYNVLGLSKYDFHDIYSEFEDYGATLDPADPGTAEDVINDETESTHVIMWVVTADELYNVPAGTDSLYHRVKYISPNSGREVTITLVAPVTAATKTYNLAPGPDYIAEYWNDEKTITYYNVNVPDVGETDDSKCVFKNDINASFVTWNTKEEAAGLGTAGMLKLDKSVTGLQYYFCKDVKNIKKIGDYSVKFTVSDDGLTLSATYNGTTEEIATITNDADAVPYNYVEYNKESDIAKMLLNTNKMYTYIGASGYICEDETKPVTITFDGKDHFQANFVRPINITEKAADYFVDAVDFGELHSFIKLEDLLDPSDWREREFADYENYWDYYGPFSFELAEDETECDLNGVRQPVPSTIVLELDTENLEREVTVNGKTKTITSEYGFLTYKNNGTHVKDFNLYVKVKVTYGWGELLTDFITVPVKETIGDTN